jgi:uncharacterized membrane protein
MYALFALVSTVLTSFLPILNKYLHRDARPALVAWAINAASLPLLAGGTLLLTQCRFTSLQSDILLSCTAHLPRMDGVFVVALLASALLNWAATLFSTSALAQEDASLVSPLLTFNPAFTLLIAWLVLREIPGLVPTVGVVLLLFGAYLLEVEEARTGLLASLRALVHRPGPMLAVAASALWGMTTVFEKLAIEHMSPPSGPFVAFTGTFLMVALLTPGAFLLSCKTDTTAQQRTGRGLGTHPRALAGAVLLAGIAPLFGFTAIALGLVGYVTALFKLSALFTILWARLFLGEGHLRQRLLGAGVMLLGGALVAKIT